MQDFYLISTELIRVLIYKILVYIFHRKITKCLYFSILRNYEYSILFIICNVLVNSAYSFVYMC